MIARDVHDKELKVGDIVLRYVNHVRFSKGVGYIIEDINKGTGKIAIEGIAGYWNAFNFLFKYRLIKKSYHPEWW